ncbi:MAG: peptidoglycan DD-metalloendopeptidase family protein [bacterium]|nr:peptidoglycan DD-metalloendopeptidase family protein [bacterium]
MDKKTSIITVFTLLVTSLMVYISSNPASVCARMLGFNKINNSPKQLYRVYLGGKSIGLIKSKQELEEFIDNKQTEIKEKYNVNKVYIPKDLDIIQEITYEQKTLSAEEIYQKIQNIKGAESFTIDGYKIVIHGIEKIIQDEEVKQTEDQTIYVLDKDIFTNSVEKTVKLFVEEEDYENFLNNNQKEIKEEGKIIEDLYIKNNITIKQDRIPTGVKIYQTEEELSKYLLFGTIEDQQTYVVKEGDTIEKISYNNKLSTDEFLIANTQYKTASDLLYPGKEVVLGVIQPQFDTVEETHTVSKKTVHKETIYEDDDTKYAGYEQVKEEGEDGISLVTEKIQYTNGSISSVVAIKDEEKVIKPVVNKVVIRGTKKYTTNTTTNWNVEIPVGVGSWGWPTQVPYTISSYFGYRWGKLHEGIDITGSYGSPIKAVNNGIVVQSGYTGINGNYITIAHSNGYYTVYAHMAQRYKKVGDVVYTNDQIGTMGKTGFATGVHLHFGVYKGMPYYGGFPVNPLQLY